MKARGIREKRSRNAARRKKNSDVQVSDGMNHCLEDTASVKLERFE